MNGLPLRRALLLSGRRCVRLLLGPRLLSQDRPNIRFAASPRKPSLFASLRPTNEATTSVDVPKGGIDLSIDTYRDENGNPWSLPIVREVERELAQDESLDHDYVDPHVGHQPFIRYASHLLLGQQLSTALKDNVVALQTISATGALRLGFEFLVKVLGLREAYLGSPSWTDYGIILQNAGIARIREYPYWDYEARRLAFDSIVQTLQRAEPGSVVVLQCGHNPTGVDPNHAEWRRLAELIKDRDLVPFFDVTNVGLFSGDPQEDAFAIRLFAEMGVEFLVAQSFSKNFGLYSERVGTLLVVSNDTAKTREVKQYLVDLSKGLWSSAPLHGARIVGQVLRVQYARELWLNQVRTMFMRTQKARKELFDGLSAKQTPGSWTHILHSGGLFCLLGLTPPQLNYLARKHNVHLSAQGRLNVCALTGQNIRQVVDAIDDSVRHA